MKNALAKQSRYLAEISPSADSTKLLNLSETEQQNKRDTSAATDVNYREINEKYLLAIGETFKKGLLSETSPFNSNMTKLFKEVKKQTKAIEKMSSDRAKEITGKSMNIDQFKTIRERIQDFGKGVKDFFTLKGFVNKTGLVKEDSGGIISTAINRRARRMEYIDERRKVDPNNIALQGLTGRQRSLAEEKLYGEQFDKQQTIKRQQRGNEAEISKLERAGFSESQIKRSGLLKTRESLAGQLEKVDSRVRVSNIGEKEKITAKRSTSKEAVSAESFSDESTLEAQRAREETVNLLAKIEENTRPVGKETGKPKKEEGGSLFGDFFKRIGDVLKGALLGALAFLKKGMLTALKFIFNPANILRFVTKIFLPAMIIGSIVNGIVDAFKAFFNGGDFVDVLVAGLGGVLEFLTFGLLDAESLKAGIEWMGNAVDEYIVEPVKQFFSWMGNIFSEYIMQPILDIGTKLYGMLDEYVLTPLANLFEPVASFFRKIKDQLFGFFEDFGIPEIGFTIPGVNKKVSIGPWYPFKKETSTTTNTNASTGATGTTAPTGAVAAPSAITPTGTTAPTGTAGTNGKVAAMQAERDAFAKKGPISNSARARQTYESILALKDKAIAATAAGTIIEEPTEKRRGQPIEEPTVRRRGTPLEEPTVKIRGTPLEEPTEKRRGQPIEAPTDKGDPRLRVPQQLSINTPQPFAGNAIYNKSANNAAAAQASQASSAPVIVNAPTSVSNTSKQNIAMPTPIRNEDSGFNRYMNKSAFVY
jgi:hypothetical protein